MKELETNTESILLNCNGCNENKPLDEFYLNEKQYAKSRHYRSSRCKICMKKYNNEKKRIEREKKGSKTDTQQISDAILTNLGYELNNPEKPVHIQFNERIREKYGYRESN